MGAAGAAPVQGNTATAVVEEGTIVTGAQTNAVMYVNSSGQLATEAAFGYNDSTNTLTVDIVTIAVGPLTVSAGGAAITGNITLASGVILAPNGTAAAPSYSFSSSAHGFYRYGASHLGVSVSGVLVTLISSAGAYLVPSGGGISWSSTSAPDGSLDLILTRDAAATLQLGVDVNGAAVAQTIKAHDGITGTDIAGANLILAGGRGTGAGAVGNLILQTSTLLASGTTAQTLSTRVTITGTTITSTLPILIPAGTAAAPPLQWSGSSFALGVFFPAEGQISFAYNSGERFRWDAANASVHMPAGYSFGWGSASTVGALDTILTREAAAVLKLGADVNGAAVAQTLKAHDGITGTDIAGAGITFASGRGTGAGASGGITLSTSTTLGTGTTAQTLVARLTLSRGAVTTDAATLTFADALNMVFNATTGTKIGTATTQKIGFWNATPVVQGATIADADGTLADITTKFNTLLSRLETYGLLASA